MRITYLKVVNFADIFVGMRKKTLEIDLSKQKTRIVLLVGPNGSGKTAILSKLHPFAYPGNMDVRSGPNLILENQDGYKEIHYDHDGNEYVIKHYYQLVSGKGIKSFISKNGVELNPNGNVSSFKELVEIELSIEQELMALLRLGSNVTGIIDKKYTDRKNFSSELLKDISVYLKLHKKISNDSRMIKSILKTVSDKINRLNITDTAVDTDKLKVMEETLVSYYKKKESLVSDIGKLKGAIETIYPEGLVHLNAKLSDLAIEQDNTIGKLTSRNRKLDETVLIIDSDISETITDLDKEIQSFDKTIEINSNMIGFHRTQLNSLYNQKEEKETNLKYVSSELEYDKLKEYHTDLVRQLKAKDAVYKDFKPKCTLDEMKKILVILHEIQDIVSNINEFDHKMIKETISLLQLNQSVDYVVKKEVGKLDDRMSDINLQLKAVKYEQNNDNGKCYILFIPSDSNCDCPYKEYYDDHNKPTTKKETDRSKLLAELDVLEHKRESLLSMLDIAKQLDFILFIIRSNKDLVDKFPDDSLFSKERIFISIKSSLPIYDEVYITSLISTLEDYESYMLDKTKIEEVKKELQFIEKNGKTLLELQNEFDSLEDSIAIVNRDIEKLVEVNEITKRKKENTSYSLEGYKMYKTIMDENEKDEKVLKDIQNDLDRYRSFSSKMKAMVIQQETLEADLNSLNPIISHNENQITDLKFRLRELKSLTEERKVLEEKYDDIELIKESLSSREGIPLLFIKLYFNDSLSTINELLYSVFKGSLEITTFIINDKEFRIPYTKNGVNVHDAQYASQGERCFLALALSFALMGQSISDYNIMKLDEVDSTLDNVFRPLFISILESQLDYIKAEQAFLITHNNMFDNYPVDIIMTADVTIDNNRNTNIIYRP